MSFHWTWSKPVQNINASPVLLRFNMPGPFCTAYIMKCIAMQKRPDLGCRGYWPLFLSISVLNTSLCRVWSKTGTSFPFKYDFWYPDHNKSSKPAPTTSNSPVIWRFALPNTQMYIHMLPIEQIHWFLPNWFTLLLYADLYTTRHIDCNKRWHVCNEDNDNAVKMLSFYAIYMSFNHKVYVADMGLLV